MEVEVNIDYNVIGVRIREARKAKNMSQEKLGEFLGVATAYVSRIERGSTKINLKRLAQVSKILDVSETELLTGTSPQHKQYLDREMHEILNNCTPEKQRLIYNIAKVISKLNI